MEPGASRDGSPDEVLRAWEKGLAFAYSSRPGAGDPSGPRFEITGELSRDDTSVLFQARDREVDRDVALRILAEMPAREGAVRTFLEEAQLAAQLQHPGILSVFGMGTLEDGRPFVAHPVSEGPTLADVLARTNGSPAGRRRRVALVEQVAHALAYAHARGVAHGRLDATRVHLGEKGEVAVSGWDGAVRANGDPAPLRADVRALGEMLAAALGKERDEELASLAESCAAADETCPRQAGEVARRIAACLADEEARALRAELEAAQAQARAEEAEAQARLERRRSKLARGARRRTRAVAAAVLLAVVLVGTGHLWRLGESRAESTRARTEVAAALREAARHEAKEDWARARAWARKAVALARGAEDEEGVRAALDRIEGRARTAEKDRELLARLDEIRERSYAWDANHIAAAYEDVLREHGLPLRELDPSAAAAAVGERTIAVAVARAVDQWVWYLPTSQHGETPHLLEIACLLDPDPLRTAIRRLRDSEPLPRLARCADIGAQPAGTLDLLAEGLAATGHLDLAKGVLREALRRTPHDSRIARRLAETLAHLDAGRTRQPCECDSCGGPRRGFTVAPSGRHARERVRVRTTILALRPRYAMAWNNLAVELERADPLELVALRKAAELDPRDALILANLTIALAEAGQVGEALRMAREAVSRDPDHAGAHRNLGWILYRRAARYDEAIRVLRQAVRLDPGDWRSYAYLGDALAGRGDDSLAAAAYRRASELTPDAFPIKRLVSRGFALLLEGKFEESAVAMREARRLDPHEASAGAVLGRALYRSKRYADAIPVLREAIDAGHPACRIDLVVSLLKLGRLEEAEEACLEAVRRDGESANARGMLGVIRCLQGDHDAAVPLLREAIRREASSTLLLSYLAWSLLGQGARDEAVRTFEKTHDSDPGSYAGLTALGMSRLLRGDPEGAIDPFRDALRVEPGGSGAIYGLAQAHVAMGQMEDAVRSLERPTPHAVSHELVEIEALRGWCLLGLNRCGEALAAADRALRIDPDHPTAIFVRGVALATLGRSEEALVALRSAAGRMPDAQEVHFNVARVCYSLGRPAEAVRAAERALECDPSAGARAYGPSLTGRIESRPGMKAQMLAVRARLHGHVSWGSALLGKHEEAAVAKRQAIALARRVAAANPADWSPWSSIGATLRALREPREALAAYRRVVALHESAETLRWLADALRDARRFEEMTVVLRRALALEPSPASLNALAWHLAACPEEGVRKPAEAAALARRALSTARQVAGIWNTLGVALYRAGDHDGAIRALTESARLRGEVDAYDGLFLAMAHWKLGHEDEASRWCTLSLKWLATPKAQAVLETNRITREGIGRLRAEAEALLGIEPEGEGR